MKPHAAVLAELLSDVIGQLLSPVSNLTALLPEASVCWYFLGPLRTLYIVCGYVNVGYSEKNVIIHPFHEWAHALFPKDISPSI